MSPEPDPVPKEFFDLADRFIHLANEMTADHQTARISAALMYAAARYNAHCVVALDPEARQNKSRATEYLVGQYRSMLEENMDGFLNADGLNPPSQ